MEIFIGMIETRGILAKLKKGEGVKYGQSAVKSFKRRMTYYNNGSEDTKDWEAAHVRSENFRKCRLITSGEEFKLADGSIVTVTDSDVNRFELLAIYEFSDGNYAEFKNSLVNLHGGGVGGKKESNGKILYFRMFKETHHSDVSLQKSQNLKYFNHAIPRDKDNNIDWHTLIPVWKIVLLSGNLLQVKREGSKLFLGSENISKSD